MMLLLLIAVFAGCIALVIGAYQILIVTPERRLLERLKPPKPAAKKVLRGVLKEDEDREAPTGLQTFVRPATAPLARLLEQAGSKQTVGAFVLLSLGVGAALGVAVASFVSVNVGIAAGIAAVAVPTLVMRHLREKRLQKFEDHFPEAVDLVARSLRAGHALPVALGMVAEMMPAPVGKEFRMLFDEQHFGLTLPDALRNFARRVPLLDARFFVTAVLIQREAGGNLAEVLDNLSSVTRERFKVKRDVRAKSAHGRMTGWVLAMLPPALFVLNGIATGGKSTEALLQDETGLLMIKIGIGLQILGTLVIRKLVRIEY
jgi:tight adherence protein B